MESFKLFVYKDERYRWVFDDSEFNLSQEAFVSGMDEVIDLLTKEIPNASAGVYVHFDEFIGSDEFPFITLTHATSLHHPKLGQSNYYFCEKLDKKVWICNNMYRYTDHTPQVLCMWVTKP
jgi:hypothetical protein